MNRVSVRLRARDDAFGSIQDLLEGKTLPPSISNESEGPRRKRRKTSRPVARASADLESGHDFVTLARVDVQIILPVKGMTPAAFAPLPTTQTRSEALPVRITAFDRETSTDSHDFVCSISTLDGDGICEATLSGHVDPAALEILQTAITVSRTIKNVTTRGTFAMRRSHHSPEAANQGLHLIAKIVVPNAKSLQDIPGLPRHVWFLNLFGPSPSAPATPWSPGEFYNNVYVPDKQSVSDLPLLEEVRCTLYPFQKRAIRWLLEREGALSAAPRDKHAHLPHGFVRRQDADGQECYVSRALGLATTDPFIFRQHGSQDLRGGILAEEMGLGKTVEMIALICLHRASNPGQEESQPPTDMRQSPATLIITPPSILQQWRDELQSLAPALKVVAYDGMKSEGSKNDDADIMRKCLENDVVLTTYPILARDIHHAEAPTKTLRHEKKYEKRLSPLTQLKWWRVVLDEAQMVESGVSNAAKVACLIPRELAWCVSGTPAKTSKDLLGLLIFLRYQPYCHLQPSSWQQLVQQYRKICTSLFQEITLRHTKSQIKDDIHLPAQKRVVITVPFSHIEEQHYSSLFQEMADECGLDVNGGPLENDWDPNNPATVEKMRTWLVRLRQTCLHPEVGSRNRKALGNNKGPLRTVAEVLEVMIEQNISNTRTEERNLLQSQIKRGQMHEQAGRSGEALRIWLSTLDEAQSIVQECRRQSQTEQTKSVETSSISPNSYEEITNHNGNHRHRLRSALEIEHVCTFFVASAYYQLKTKAIGSVNDQDLENNPGMCQALPGEAEEFEHKEGVYYEKAKQLRRELLADARTKADSLVHKVRDTAKTMVPVDPIGPLEDPGGIQTRPYFDRIQSLLANMRDQVSQLAEWRSKATELLTVPLVDEEKKDLEGDEYEISTKHQDQVYVYVDALKAIVSDCHDVLTGQDNLLIDHEMKMSIKKAKDGEGHSPQMLLQLLRRREGLKAPRHLGSVRGLITELRELKNNLRGSVERSNARAAAETIIVNSLSQHLHRLSSEQTKVTAALAKEVELFTDTMNVRLEYYKQLQAISDTVAPFAEEMGEEARETMLLDKKEAEDEMKIRITSLRSKSRYLIHLRDDAADTRSQRICIVCRDPFEAGILTTCGHTYCGVCLRAWWAQHRNCPTCKKHLSRNDFYQITYKPKELTIEEEGSSLTEKDWSSNDKASAIYSGVRTSVFNQIKDIDLDGSFGTKIDTLARHMLWIREHDPGAKSIIFSQYRDFLDVLGRAFRQFSIAFTSIDKKDGIQKFKRDPGVECFFLHAKAQSSGLNLVNATHVFLCEPLINTAIELQAIARVHRIGQHSETTVWMYLVEGTVEKSIYDISVQRRLAQIGRLQQATDKAGNEGEAEPLENQIEAANSLELEQKPLSQLLTSGSSGGELVRQEDLWNCLFSSRVGQKGQEAQLDVSRHPGAEAAHAREGVAGL